MRDWDATWHAMPSFVTRAPLVDFWGVSPIGIDAADFQAGARHLKTALQFAADYQLQNFPSMVLAAISGRTELGPMERGFIDALSRKAAVACLPVLDEEAQNTPDVVDGYEYARIFLETRDPETIRVDIESTLLNDGGSLFAGAVLHTYCRAAQLGALH
jgi:hypothetical protein